MGNDSLQAFDPNQPYSVVWRRLPHWAQGGTVCFITWRTADSMPRKVVERWIEERNALLLKEGIRVNDAGFGDFGPSVCSRVSPKPERLQFIEPNSGFGETGPHSRVSPKAESSESSQFLGPQSGPQSGFGETRPHGFGETRLHWRRLVERLPPGVRSSLQGALTERFEGHLDACHGACLLRRRELATIVAESLQKFDGDRYELADFVVMPNHVHLLVAFPDEKRMLTQCASWKRYTARKINEATGQCGEFWQEEAFDHLVRSPEQFEHYRRYIADNGPRARLPATDYLLSSRM